MKLSLIFWVIVIVALVFGALAPRNTTLAAYVMWPIFVLVVILGIGLFGFHITTN